MKPVKINHGFSKTSVFITTLIVAISAISFGMHEFQENKFPAALRGLAVSPKPIGDVKLVDKNGKTLSDDYFKGKWTMVFFGYTNCPDVCPSTLMQMVNLYKSIRHDPQTGPYQFLFITVDPARDKQARIKEYVEYFNKDFNAARGDIANIKHFEKVFGAFHHYQKKSPTDTNYSVAHSAEVYIVSPNERFVGKFLPPINVNKLTIKLTKLNAFISQHAGGNA